MTDERDTGVSRRYAELGREEPPEALDRAIIAAACRAVEARPAPLVAPADRRSWRFPLAAAAVIVLSVAVSWHLQLEERAPGGPAPEARAPQPAARVPAPEAPVTQERPRAAPVAKAAQPERRDAQPAQEPPPAPPPAVLASPAASGSAPATPEAVATAKAEGGPAAAEPVRSLRLARNQDSAAELPEKWLERIAALRSAGRHEEADRALEEFRKRHPDYRIAEEVRKRVERP
jgi:hypothetical protein